MGKMGNIIVIILVVLIICFTAVIAVLTLNNKNESVEKINISKLDSMVEGSFQAEVTFPDWKGYIDDTLAMNSMYSFNCYKDQGKLYFNIDENVESFELFVNNTKINVETMKNGVYELDISKLTKNGTNTVQVCNIVPNDLEKCITMYVPYPEVIEGKLEEVGLKQEPFDLISDIIEADIENGFSSAQMAVIKDGKLVYKNAWGNVNAYNQDGTKIEDGVKVTNSTLYDLASNTKMYSVAYAIQNLMDNNKISLDDKIVDLIGSEFVDNTIEIKFSAYKDNYPGFETIKRWKSEITVQDVLMHRAGFPDGGHFHNAKYDTENQKLTNDVDNVMYIENATKEKTLKEGICKMPLIYQPRTKVMYSDLDYMLLGIIVEKITGKDLNSFLKETYWDKMNLKNITYNPLQNGFKKDNIAATELNGNTRDSLVDFPGVRKETIQGEVHDEGAYYAMEGMSGHAGLFSNAEDLARLATVMLSGGYGNNKFFSKNIRDLFIAPQTIGSIHYGIGWWREADDKRVYHFGTQSPESTVGHQGWTGTLTMIDFENNMVVVFLTNSINTPIVDKSSLETANDFAGRYYTTSTLGFVPQIIYTGLNSNEKNIDEALNALVKDMANEKQRLIDSDEKKNEKKYDESHPIIKAKKALDEVVSKRMKK